MAKVIIIFSLPAKRHVITLKILFWFIGSQDDVKNFVVLYSQFMDIHRREAREVIAGQEHNNYI